MNRASERKKQTMLVQLRWIGQAEALSYLVLLFLAMPLKYIAGMPLAVSIVGMLHGLLWMAYVGWAFAGQWLIPWHWKETAWYVLASFLPFGPYIAEAKLLKPRMEDSHAQ